jgi:primosomal protein N''
MSDSDEVSESKGEEAGASRPGWNILGIEQRTLSSAVRRKDQRLGRCLSGQGKMELGRLVLKLARL